MLYLAFVYFFYYNSVPAPISVPQPIHREQMVIRAPHPRCVKTYPRLRPIEGHAAVGIRHPLPRSPERIMEEQRQAQLYEIIKTRPRIHSF